MSVEGLFLEASGEPGSNDPAWEEILPVQPCGPSQRHIFQLGTPTDKAYSHVKLNMIPDGGKCLRKQSFNSLVYRDTMNRLQTEQVSHASGYLVKLCQSSQLI